MFRILALPLTVMLFIMVGLVVIRLLSSRLVWTAAIGAAIAGIVWFASQVIDVAGDLIAG